MLALFNIIFKGLCLMCPLYTHNFGLWTFGILYSNNHGRSFPLFCIIPVQLTQCEVACQSLEVELADHRKTWEESMITTEKHKAIIDQLTAKQATLEEEVTKREERVAELEALLTEVNWWCIKMCRIIIYNFIFEGINFRRKTIRMDFADLFFAYCSLLQACMWY